MLSNRLEIHDDSNPRNPGHTFHRYQILFLGVTLIFSLFTTRAFRGSVVFLMMLNLQIRGFESRPLRLERLRDRVLSSRKKPRKGKINAAGWQQNPRSSEIIKTRPSASGPYPFALARV